MPTEVIMPKVDMDMETGTIASWHAGDGDMVEKGNALFDIETDKATMEVESPASGRLHIISETSGTEIAIGKAVAWILDEGEKAPDRPLEPTDQTPAKPDETSSNGVDDKRRWQPGAARLPADTAQSTKTRATPLARRLARQNSIDISTVSGSGPRGRITKDDIKAHLSAAGASDTATTASVSDRAETQAAAFAADTPHERIPVDRMRATIAARLTESKTTIPHFYLDADCRLDALLELRKQINKTMEDAGRRRISVNDFLIKACAMALQDVPQANASWAGDSIIQYLTADISVAVAIDGGLVTPVVRNAAALSMSAISGETASLAEQARQGKLSPDAYKGGSFSISNLGMYGVKSFSAIINPPQSMILAVGEARRIFVPDTDDQPVAATILPVTLSCDHRVVDGALGAEWLQRFRTYIESPIMLLV